MGLPPIEPQGPPPVEVYRDLTWVMTAFNRLSPRRPQGMNGPLRIPISEIESYSRLLDLDLTRRNDLLFYLERMDDVYMEYVAKALDEEEKKRQVAANKAKAAGRKGLGR